MNNEKSYTPDYDQPTPEKEYRKLIDAWLHEKTANVAIAAPAKKRKRKVDATNKRSGGPPEKHTVLVSTKEKKRWFIRHNKYREAVDDAVDSFLATCERFGLNRNAITATSLENACISRDSRFLPDELISLIISNKAIKESLGDLSLIVKINQQSILEGRKLSASPSQLRRNAERIRRFYRTGVNTYIDRLHELEESVDALKDMTVIELQELDGDIRKIADTVSAIAERIAKEIRRRDAQAGASGKLANDPKQADKQQVRECWELWQQDPSRYKGPTAFARDMRAKFENLESEEVIRRWCREWKNATEPAQ